MNEQAALKTRFGDRLRQLRERRGLTLKEVACRVGVSQSLVSQIETGKVSPSLDTLLALADALETDLDYLFRGLRRSRPVHLVRRSERDRLVLGKVTYEKLSKTAGDEGGHAMEAYLLTIPPGAEKGSDEYGHAGQELGLVLEGRGEFRIGDERYGLAAGDSLSFAADVPHLLRNPGPGSLRALWVTTPPRFPGS